MLRLFIYWRRPYGPAGRIGQANRCLHLVCANAP